MPSRLRLSIPGCGLLRGEYGDQHGQKSNSVIARRPPKGPTKQSGPTLLRPLRDLAMTEDCLFKRLTDHPAERNFPVIDPEVESALRIGADPRLVGDRRTFPPVIRKRNQLPAAALLAYRPIFPVHEPLPSLGLDLPRPGAAPDIACPKRLGEVVHIGEVVRRVPRLGHQEPRLHEREHHPPDGPVEVMPQWRARTAPAGQTAPTPGRDRPRPPRRRRDAGAPAGGPAHTRWRRARRGRHARRTESLRANGCGSARRRRT